MVGYDFYIDSFKGGSVTVEEWPLFEARAAEQLARYKRIYTVSAPDENAEAMAVCAMADAIAFFAAAQNGAGGVVSSASIGSVSVSYAGAAQAVDLSPRGQARELLRCAGMYLDIYRGVG
ncbi:MAG: hypothetical protein J6C98_10300 [Oscillospiraceae bacterium]|nr:hypothetical protein [Oscillospiraceae bacterium]